MNPKEARERQEDFGEPWGIEAMANAEDAPIVVRDTHRKIFKVPLYAHAVISRAITCVNACKGIPTDLLEREGASVEGFWMQHEAVVNRLANEIESLKAENAELRELLAEATDKKLAKQIKKARAEYKRTGGVPFDPTAIAPKQEGKTGEKS